MADQSLLQRLQQRHGQVGAAAYSGALCLVVLALAAAAGLALELPWLFPSLGPTVMLFFESPQMPTARPRNALVGHLVGIAVGALCLLLFGLYGEQPALVGGLTVAYVAAGVLSMLLTTVILTLLGTRHPPADASTLIVSLGLLTTPAQVASMVGGVVLITVAGWGLNRLLGTRTGTEH